MKALFSLICLLLTFSPAYAQGNFWNDSFITAKKALERHVYYDYRVTLYCNATFNAQKQITLPKGFNTSKYIKRSKRIEWEHVVPAENFGRTFQEWREGNPKCIDRKGKPFKGRKCAEKANLEYRYMQSDMYNLYPAIGSVNAMRSNFNFQMLPGEASDFGSCEVKITNRKVEPPAQARGQIARTYQYMEKTYSRYRMSQQQRQLMHTWNTMYPVEPWECIRAKRIEKIQGNTHLAVKQACQGRGLW